MMESRERIYDWCISCVLLLFSFKACISSDCWVMIKVYFLTKSLSALTQLWLSFKLAATSHSQVKHVTDMLPQSFIKWSVNSFPRRNVSLLADDVEHLKGHGTEIELHSVVMCLSRSACLKLVSSLQRPQLNVKSASFCFKYLWRGLPSYFALHMGQRGSTFDP